MTARFGTGLLLSVAVTAYGSVFQEFRPQAPENQSSKSVPQIVKETANSIFLLSVRIPGGEVQGSGFAATEDGLIVTNYHVIEGGTVLSAKLPNGAHYRIAGIVAVDKKKDLAVLKADGHGFAALTLADSTIVEVGEDVVAIGSPRGLEASVSTGIVSGIRVDEDVTLIQTTAPISHGSSGGVLLNRRGEVIGITTLSVRSGQNLNLAVASNHIKPMLTLKPVRSMPELDPSSSALEVRNALQARCQKVRCGRIRLRVTPNTARVAVDDAPVGIASDLDSFGGDLDLPPGTYRIKFEADGYVSEARDVAVSGGRTVTVRVALRRN